MAANLRFSRCKETPPWEVIVAQLEGKASAVEMFKQQAELSDCADWFLVL
jgi:hypothetical protein